MSAHGVITEPSVSDHPVTHDRKGREGKGIGREVSHPCLSGNWEPVFGCRAAATSRPPMDELAPLAGVIA